VGFGEKRPEWVHRTLTKLGHALRKDFPQLRVEMYFAAWNGDERGTVEFLGLEK
jgi:hypothetical protein